MKSRGPGSQEVSKLRTVQVGIPEPCALIVPWAAGHCDFLRYVPPRPPRGHCVLDGGGPERGVMEGLPGMYAGGGPERGPGRGCGERNKRGSVLCHLLSNKEGEECTSVPP